MRPGFPRSGKSNFFYLTILAALSIVSPYTGDLRADSNKNIIKHQEINLSSQIEVFIDNSGKDSLSDMVEREDFQPHTGNEFQFGLNPAIFWLRFKIPEGVGEGLDHIYLYINWGLADNFDLYVPMGKDRFVLLKNGRDLPVEKRRAHFRNFLYELPSLEKTPYNKERYFYMRMHSLSSIVFTVNLASPEVFWKSESIREAVFMICLGVLGVMSFYNFFVFGSLRERAYLYYVLYVIILGFYLASFNGNTLYLWPNSPEWNQNFVLVTLFSGLGFCLLFVRSFLNEINGPVLNKILAALFVLHMCVTLLALQGFAYHFLGRLAHVSGPLVYMLILLLGLRGVWKGYPPARYFLVAWFFFFVGTTVFVTRNMAILPESPLSRYGLYIGITMEVTTLSLALAARINLMRKELLDLNRGLEIKVQERTNALSELLEKLQEKEREMDQELKLASRIQADIFPDLEAYEQPVRMTAHREYYTQVGGDFYDVIRMPDGDLGILMADVSGHGVPASLITTMAKVAFKDATEASSSPYEIFIRVNEVMVHTIQTGDYLTALLLIISPEGNLKYCSASHLPALLWRRESGEIESLGESGIMLGIIAIEDPNFEGLADNRFTELKTSLALGDRLLLYTDGMTEALNPEGEELGGAGLQDIFRRTVEMGLEEAREDILYHWRKFRNGAPSLDDTTFLLVEYTGPTPESEPIPGKKSSTGKNAT